jgi:hypothetical protein
VVVVRMLPHLGLIRWARAGTGDVKEFRDAEPFNRTRLSRVGDRAALRQRLQ